MKVVSIDKFYKELKKYGHLEMGMVNKTIIHDIFEKIKFDVNKEELNCNDNKSC